MSIKSVILEEMASVSAESKDLSKATPPPPIKAMYDQLSVVIPKVIAWNKEGEGGRVSEVFHSLSTMQRHIHLPTTAGTADDIKLFWTKLNVADRNAHEKFLCISGIILKFINSDPLIKPLFQSFVRKYNNNDVTDFNNHLIKGTAEPFAISKVANPAYHPPFGVNIEHQNSFLLVRLLKMKMDLLECIISTFDTCCFHRSIHTGFESCDSDDNNEEQEDRPRFIKRTTTTTFFNNYEKAENPADKPFTQQKITKEGIKDLFDLTLLHPKGINADMKVISSTEFHDNLKENFLPQMYKNIEKKTINCFPLFRLLLDVFGLNKRPLLHELASRDGSCRIKKDCRTTVMGCEQRLVHHGPALVGRNFQWLTGPENAVFCTKVAVKCQFTKLNLPPKPRADQIQSSASLASQDPVQTEVFFEILDRNSKQLKVIASSKPGEASRGLIMIPKVYEASLEPGWMAQKDPEHSKALIDDFFESDYFLNIDPTVMLYNLTSEDRFSISLDWEGVEGSRAYLSCYLLATYLKSSLEIGYRKEASFLLSRAVNENDAYARSIINNCFPDLQQRLNKADAIHNDPFDDMSMEVEVEIGPARGEAAASVASESQQNI